MKLQPALTAILLSVTVCGAGPANYWTWRNPLPARIELSGMSSDNGIVVIAGGGGSLASDDLQTWFFRLPGFLNGEGRSIRVESGDGMFIVHAVGGGITSKDGLAWGNYVAFPPVKDMAFGGESWVGVGDGGRIFTSTNAVDWVDNTIPDIHNNLHSVTFGNGTFVAVGEAATSGSLLATAILTSTDGQSWTIRNSRTIRTLRAIAFASDRFVAVGDGGYVTKSTNGTEWTAATSAGSEPLVSLACAETKTMLLSSTGAIYVSQDREQTWRQALSNSHFTEISYFPSKQRFLAVGGSLLESSSDGTEWKSHVSWINPPLHAVTYGPHGFVGLGGGIAAVSRDGVRWHTARGDHNAARAITFGNGLYVAVGGGAEGPNEVATIQTSLDGLTWQKRTTPITRIIRDVTYGDGWFVAVANGSVIRSTNGTQWSEVSLNSDLSTAAYGNGLFVVAGSSNIFTARVADLTLPTGWTQRDSGLSGSIDKIIFDGDKFVGTAVSTSDLVLTSPDGELWLRRTTGLTLKKITFGGGYYIALVRVSRSYDDIYTSSNLIDWSPDVAKGPYEVSSIAYGDGSFIILGGESGEILQSNNLFRPRFRPDEIADWNGEIILSIEGPSEAVYHVERTDSFGTWQTLGEFTSTNGVATARDPAFQSMGFYRAEIRQPEQ